MPPLIIRVLPNMVEAWCFRLTPPLALSHSLFSKLKISSSVLNRLPFSPSKLWPPVITMLFR